MVKLDDFAQEYIPSKVKYAFGLGSAGNLALSNLAYGSITYFYNTKIGLSGELIGIAWLIFGIWNALNDPLFGWLTDNTRSALGRRIPYLRYGSLIYGLLFVLVWYPTFSMENQIALFINFLVVMIAFDTAFTMLSTVYFCLPSEMADTADQRASISWYGTVCNFVAIGIQFIVPAITLTGSLGVNVNLYFRPIMIFLAILCSGLIFMSSFYIREREFAQIQQQESFMEGLKKTIKNKSFIAFELAGFCITLLTWILMTGMFYYLDYIVVFDIRFFFQNWWILILVGIAIYGIVKTILYQLDHIQSVGPRKFMIIALAILACGFGLIFVAGRTFYLAIWGFLLIGLGYIMGNITVSPLMGDVMDYDELQTGTRREGAYAGLNAIITKPAISIANWAFLGIIGFFGFQRPEIIDGISIKLPQTDLAITGILFSFGIIPMVFALIAIVGMRGYKLYGEEWAKKKKELDQIHIQKERDYMQHLFEEERMGDLDPDFFKVDY
jgi:GPH family glycoside/pentoside/hexuronide:cation symporter